MTRQRPGQKVFANPDPDWGVRVIQPAAGALTYQDKVLGYNPIAYWMLAEAAGTTAVDQVNSPAQDGTYGRDVAVMGTGAGIGDGNTAPFFDGVQDYCDVFSAALAAAFGQNTGTIMVWARVANAGVWTDGAWRMTFSVSGAGGFYLYDWGRPNVNNNLRRLYTPGGGGVNDPAYGGVLVWMCLLCTWDVVGGQYRAYIDGVEYLPVIGVIGAIGAVDAAVLGAWCEAAYPNNPWHGWLAHAALWDVILTGPQIADLATV